MFGERREHTRYPFCCSVSDFLRGSLFAPGFFGDIFEEVEREFATYPRVGTVEPTEDGYNVSVNLPGLGRDDVSVQAKGNRLEISVDKGDKEKPTERYRLIGHVKIPRVDFSKVTAKMDKGVLRLYVPKLEEETTEIEVK